jgi:hypothetical protein
LAYLNAASELANVEASAKAGTHFASNVLSWRERRITMTKEKNSPDPYQRDMADNDIQRAERVDNKLQADPALVERPVRSGRIALYAIAIAVVLGALFYGFNSSTGPTGTNSTASQSTSSSTALNNNSKPPVAPGVRDVTPSNAQPGVTTGAAPAKSTPPATPQSGNTATPDAAK